jgi:hypothetical protein
LDYFVQFWTSILEINSEEKGCWVCFGLGSSAPLSQKHFTISAKKDQPQPVLEAAADLRCGFGWCLEERAGCGCFYVRILLS